MITYVKGDIFSSPAKILVNTVNTVGVVIHDKTPLAAAFQIGIYRGRIAEVCRQLG